MKNKFKYKRVICISDVHGCYDLLKKLFKDINFNPAEDMIVQMGDVIDRGSDSKQVVLYLQALRQRYPDNFIVILGNHEHLCLEAIKGGKYSKEMSMWLMNGGQSTIDSFGGIEQTKDVLLPYIKSLSLYYETETHIFVHAGIPQGETVLTATTENLLWDRSFSYDGDKTLIVGHTPHREVTKYKNGKIICVDCGVCLYGVLAAYDVINKKVYKVVDSNRRESETLLSFSRN